MTSHVVFTVLHRSAWSQIPKVGWSLGGFEHSGAEAEQRERRQPSAEPAAAGVFCSHPSNTADMLAEGFTQCVAACVFEFQL